MILQWPDDGDKRWTQSIAGGSGRLEDGGDEFKTVYTGISEINYANVKGEELDLVLTVMKLRVLPPAICLVN